MNKAYLLRGILRSRSGSHDLVAHLVRQAEEKRGLTLGDVRYLPSGKPVFDREGWHLSVSHSGTTLLVAIAPFPVGIDLEIRRAAPQRVRQRFFSPREQEADFFRVWTAKEAVSKLSGGGLGLVRRIAVDGDRATLDGESYHLRQWEEGELVITLAAAEPFSVEE